MHLPKYPTVVATLLLALAGCAATPAVAAEKMKPGLWEYTMRVEMPGMPAMAPQTYKHCLTQAEIDQGDHYLGQGQDPDCKTTNFKQFPGKVSYDYACEDSIAGHFEVVYTAAAMTGKGVTTVDGEKTTTLFSAKLLGACK